MEENNKGGFSAEGRKLRPRRPRISGTHSEKVEYDRPQRNFEDRPRRNYGDGNDRPRRNFGEGRPNRNYGDNQERRSYGDRSQRSYGDRPRRNYGDNQERRSYGDRQQRSYGDRPQRSYGDNQERRSYGDRQQRSYGDRPQRPYGDNDRRSYGEGRPRRNFNDNRQGGRPAGRKPGFAAKRQAPRKDEGISKMLARKPIISDMQFSDNDTVKAPIKEEIRLNKFIANSGVCSRREADQLIQAGVVTVNGEVVTELGTKVNILKDEVKFNGETLKGEEKVYIIMNKPKGYVTTASDPHAEKTVMDLLKGCTARVFPVGRLDKSTTGVLMFTNDGDIAEKLTHPSYDKKKIYQVILDRPVAQEDFNKILAGVELSDGPVAADELEYIDSEDHKKIGIEIHSGKNRIVRRIFESLGYDVKALDRVYFAGLTKKGLKKGEWRFLTEGESNILKMGAYM
ncbi:MAG: pseudouridine synthase [Bacteroidales bacterium]|nr:pseudouridine synthase [Bacteroidales bacterium]MBO7365306.1 pseudouridine synthase [Bacteroidales bacterium]MBR4409616.1 pseudouridine synthase [Bacteroidales bacterium]MBR5955673.1 pseudouridine synthase [Bacteroidales bacterium]